ncbi:uncharacterized protein BDR25DRAFT_172129, partial [Lindgomyces ingoldianus]
FNSPWSKTLEGLRKTAQGVPGQHKSEFDKLSTKTLEVINNTNYLHVWETDSDADNLLQLATVIVKIRSITTYVPHKTGPANYVPAGMVVLTEESTGDRDNFIRVCDMVKHIMRDPGQERLNGKVKVFSNIAVVRGVNNAKTPDNDGKYDDKATAKVAQEAVNRINVVIDRILKLGVYEGHRKKIVWHNGPVLHFLLYFINFTTAELRNALAGITVHSVFTFFKLKQDPSVAATGALQTTALGRKNSLQVLSRFTTYLTKLKITATFTDTESQLLNYNLNTYVSYWGYNGILFAPSRVWTPHLHATMDALVTFCFRLRGACDKKSGQEVVEMVYAHLTPKHAKPYAKTCINASSYTTQLCRSAGADMSIHDAVSQADAPIQPLSNRIPALSRLAIGPASNSCGSHLAAPIEFEFNRMEMRISSSSPFRFLLPLASDDVEKARARTVASLNVVTNCISDGHGTLKQVKVEKEVKEAWVEMKTACLWALDGCKGRLPKGMEEKVRYVGEKLRGGQW